MELDIKMQKRRKEKVKVYSMVQKLHKKGLILLPLSAAMLLMSPDKAKVMGPKMETCESSILMKLKDSDLF